MGQHGQPKPAQASARDVNRYKMGTYLNGFWIDFWMMFQVFVACYMLFVVCCQLSVACGLLLAVCCLFGVLCSFAICCLLFFVCGLPCVV